MARSIAKNNRTVPKVSLYNKQRLAKEIDQYGKSIKTGYWNPKVCPHIKAVVDSAVEEARRRRYWRESMQVATRYGRFKFYVTTFGRVCVDVNGLKVSSAMGVL